jgi:hypothetical protein
MKMLLTAFVLVMASDSRADFISKRFSYINQETLERIEISKINQDTQVGTYFDHEAGKYKTVNLSDVSKQVSESVSGVKENDMVLVKFDNNKLRPCEVWYLYQNGYAHVGCQNGKILQQSFIERADLSMYGVLAESVVKGTKELDGFAQKDKVHLMKDVGDLKKGDLVRIEHIFANGYAMIQKMGTNLIDTSSLLKKSKVQVVDLKDLAF